MSRKDTLRFLAAMALPAMAVCVVSTLASFHLLGIGLSMLALLGLLIWLVVSILRVLTALIRARWRLLALRAIALGVPVLLVVCRALPSGDLVHLALIYPTYRTRIAATTERPVRFPWGEDPIMIFGMSQNTLLYDDTPAGPARVGQVVRLPDGGARYTRHLIGSFFVENLLY